MSLSAVIGDVASAIRPYLTTAAVTLRDGTAFTVDVAPGRTRTTDITDGLEQQRLRVLVMASDWDAVSPRAPEKGDLLVINGRRHRIDDVKSMHAANEIAAYRFLLEG